MAQNQSIFAPFTFLGILLIILGIILVALPILSRLFDRLDKIHPLLVWGTRVDGFFIGTSPILIIALLLIYLILLALRS
ncbi:MAG: hypothetical protein NXY59_05930 [Aigarchaeota archaeon]|nr:hypothetical protein [Candidatus Pelearchaeum maunauluense]